jgi:N-acetylglucosamine kinase-like BadF-type ATPase
MINWWDRLPTLDPVDTFALVDGGGTHCRVAICNRHGELLGYEVAGPTNARAVGDARALTTLVAVIEQAITASGVGSVGLCMVTTAAVDTAVQADRLAAGVRPVAGDGAVVVVAPDTLGCWAVTNDLGPAVAVIAGTGSVVVAADREQHKWLRLGGWDYILGDEGSGFGLARATLREALFTSEGRSDAHALAQSVLTALGLDDPDGIADAVHKPTVDKARIAALAAIPLSLAAAGDKAAMQIVRSQVEPLADAAAHAIVRLESSSPLIGCFGGTFKSNVFRTEFEAALHRLLPDRLTVPLVERSALVGAFMIAMAQSGSEPHEVKHTAAAFADQLAERTGLEFSSS